MIINLEGIIYIIMPPYRMDYIRSQKCYTVKKTKSKKNAKPRVFSKCTTRKNAIKQIRLLRAILYNPHFKRTLKKTTPISESLSSSHNSKT